MESIELRNDNIFIYKNKSGNRKLTAIGEYGINADRIIFSFNKQGDNTDLLPLTVLTLNALTVDTLRDNRRIVLVNEDHEPHPMQRIILNPGAKDQYLIYCDLSGELTIKEGVEVREIQVGSNHEVLGRFTLPSEDWSWMELIFQSIQWGSSGGHCFSDQPLKIEMSFEGSKLRRDDTNEEYIIKSSRLNF